MSATPTLRTWTQNSRMHDAAETVLQGLQLAKEAAVNRNTEVRFQLTSTLDDNCVLDPHGRNWVLNLDAAGNPAAVENRCGHTDSETADPRILSRRRLGATEVLVNATKPTVAFNGFGQPTPRLDAPVIIDVTSADGGACSPDATGPACLRIVVTPGGMLRMCNPQLGASHAADPRAC